jgi:uncharacterized SAM-binding protein YcdF (DUF218 family)
MFFSLLKKPYRILLLLLLLPALLILGEFAFFAGMTRSAPALQKADLIAVFTGDKGRVEEGFQLANRGYSPDLVISRASSQTLGRFKKKLETSNTFDCVVEDASRTTFENALHTKRIMSGHGMRSVILVTSWDHMPRAYLLLSMLTHGSNVRIQRCTVPTGRLDGTNWYCSSEGWKRAWNEMMKFWGSFYELADYRIRGRVPHRAPNQSQMVTLLRKMLLFDLEPIRS